MGRVQIKQGQGGTTQFNKFSIARHDRNFVLQSTVLFEIRIVLMPKLDLLACRQYRCYGSFPIDIVTRCQQWLQHRTTSHDHNGLVMPTGNHFRKGKIDLANGQHLDIHATFRKPTHRELQEKSLPSVTTHFLDNSVKGISTWLIQPNHQANSS